MRIVWGIDEESEMTVASADGEIFASVSRDNVFTPHSVEPYTLRYRWKDEGIVSYFDTEGAAMAWAENRLRESFKNTGILRLLDEMEQREIMRHKDIMNLIEEIKNET